MSKEFYLHDPRLRNMFLALSREMQNAIDQCGIEICTPGELTMWTEHYRSGIPDMKGQIP